MNKQLDMLGVDENELNAAKAHQLAIIEELQPAAFEFAFAFHRMAQLSGWWTNLETGEPLERNVGEMLCLVHSEISEAMEGHRKNKRDPNLTHRMNIEVELADAVIRIFDIGNGLGLDVVGAMMEKAMYNAQRADHKIENRVKEDGKKY